MNSFENENNPEQLIAAAAAALDNKEIKSAALKRLLMIATKPEHIVKGFFDYTDAIEKTQKSGILSPTVVNNQNLLMSLLMSTAVRELNDQEIISRLVNLRLFKLDVMQSLVEKCTDENALKGTVEFGRYDSADAGSLAGKATYQIKDQKYLAELLVNKNTAQEVRFAAAYKVEDQGVLEKIAADSSDNASVRGTVASKITNQKLLKTIVEKEEDKWVRCGAVKGITDQEYLINLAFNDKEDYVKDEATKHIESQEVLLKLFHESPSNSVKASALKRINDQRLILNIALDESVHFSVRISAEQAIADEEIQKEFFLKAKNEQSRRTALAHIKDMDFVVDVVYNDIMPQIRMDALPKVNDPNILNEIANLHFDPAIKAKANDFLIRYHKDYSPIKEPTTAENLAESALQLIEKGQVEDAKKAALAAILEDENLAKARIILADLQAKNGDYSEASKQYHQFIRIEPLFASGWRAAALILGKLGETSQSADFMKRAAALGDQMAKDSLAVTDRGDTCNFCNRQVSVLETAVSSNGINICIDCMGLSEKVVTARTPIGINKKRRGLVTTGSKTCSFCAKTEYRTLVDSGTTAICDSCVDEFFKIK